MKQAFFDLLHSEIQLKKDSSDMEHMYEMCLRLHTHDCDQNKKRCFVNKRNSAGKSVFVCRFPPYETSNTLWLKDISISYREQTLQILKKLGLAYRVDDFDHN